MCSLLEHPDDGKRLFPWEVRGKGYGTIFMVTIGSTNPNSINLAGKIILLGKRVNIPLYFICKTSEIGTTRTCREFFSNKNSAIRRYYTYHSIGSSNIYAYSICCFHIITFTLYMQRY